MKDSPDCFSPPVWNINADTIYDQLKILIENKELRKKMAIQGREYVLKNNNVKKVVTDMLKKLEIEEPKFDYNA